MKLGPEHERPFKINAAPPGKEPVRVAFTDEEWLEYLERMDAHLKKVDEEARTEYLRKREAEFEKYIYPYMNEAMAQANLEGNQELLNSLRDKRKEIISRYPEM